MQQYHSAPWRRTAMLAASGALMAATALGWLKYAENQQAGGFARMVAASTTPQVRARPLPAAPRLVQQAAAQASAVGQATAAVQQPQARPAPHVVAQPPSTRGAWLVPPPPEPAGENRTATALSSGTAAASLPAAEQPDGLQGDGRQAVSSDRLRALPLVQAVRLTGLIDGKAFFVMPKDVAQEKHLPSAFSLAPGEQFADLTLEGMTNNSASLRDGNMQVAIKQLAAIR